MGDLLCFFGGVVFLSSIIAHIWVKVRMRPESDLEEYHFEFEEHHSGYSRYERWSRITFVGAAAGALLLFTGLAL